MFCFWWEAGRRPISKENDYFLNLFFPAAVLNFNCSILLIQPVFFFFFNLAKPQGKRTLAIVVAFRENIHISPIEDHKCLKFLLLLPSLCYVIFQKRSQETVP